MYEYRTTREAEQHQRLHDKRSYKITTRVHSVAYDASVTGNCFHECAVSLEEEASEELEEACRLSEGVARGRSDGAGGVGVASGSPATGVRTALYRTGGALKGRRGR